MTILCAVMLFSVLVCFCQPVCVCMCESVRVCQCPGPNHWDGCPHADLAVIHLKGTAQGAYQLACPFT